MLIDLGYLADFSFWNHGELLNSRFLCCWGAGLGKLAGEWLLGLVDLVIFDISFCDSFRL